MVANIKEMTGAEFPLFAFSHCRDVVAAVSRAGGFGVLGGSSFTPETLAAELDWIVEHSEGKPFGIDILIPENLDFGSDFTADQLAERIPARHRDFTIELLARHGVPMSQAEAIDRRIPQTSPAIGEALLDIAFRYPIRLIANALGIAPPRMLELGREKSVPVAALVGAKEHALRQVKAGVDILVAQGTEAGGHCGEVSTLVLVPEVIAAIRPVREVPVLAAGGIMTGRQMAASMAMGAAGAWTGSVWLATVESETTEIFREKMIAASSRDAVRSKGRTGKPARQLRSVWTDAWDRGPDSPGALPMPLQSILSRDAFNSIDRAAAAGNAQARDLVSYFVGQGVGLVDSVKSAGAVVQEFKEDFVEAVEHMNALLEE
jgi:NAD(P)H-dependent flavin oxidoreductase YrpB (nitropropane dioxygenase family)